MSFLYHRVPDHMMNDTLLPLNELKKWSLSLYHSAMEKYLHREDVVRQEIPELGCGWGDVIFLSAVHPKVLHEALFAAGHRPAPAKYFAIPIHRLNLYNTRVMRVESVHPRRTKFEEKFNPSDISGYAQIPQATLDYFKESGAKRINPLRHRGIPQILYRGTISIKGCEKILAGAAMNRNGPRE